jgi:hypothetical protein
LLGSGSPDLLLGFGLRVQVLRFRAKGPVEEAPAGWPYGRYCQCSQSGFRYLWREPALLGSGSPDVLSGFGLRLQVLGFR